MVNLGRLSLVVLATIVIFAAGAVTGGLLVRQRESSRAPAQPAPFVNRFDVVRQAVEQVPDLTPEQRDRIQKIVRESQDLMAEYFRILQPDTQQVFRGMRESIRSELSVAQRKRFEEAMRSRFGGGGNRGPQEGVRSGPNSSGPSPAPGTRPGP